MHSVDHQVLQITS